MASRKAGKTHAESRDQSRKALMDAGAAMLLEEATRNPFAGMRVRELCERAGYSTGTFYARWRDARAFYEELAEHLLAGALADDFDELREVAHDAAQLDGIAAIVHLANADLEILLSNEQWDAVELLTVTWARTSLQDAAREGYRAIDRLTAETYEIVLNALGREPCDPLEPHHVGVVLQALVEGFALRAKVDPAGIEPPDEHSPSMYSIAIAAVLAALTRPRGTREALVETLEAKLAPGGPGVE